MKFILPVIVGAVIGYITNWLAIKMLFRPHEEKKFLGIKIPFTPGLIPKERGRIAYSIGETIGNHLLTPEILVDALCSERIKSQFRVLIEKKLIDIKTSNLTIENIISQALKDNKGELVGRIEAFIHRMIISQIQRPELAERVKSIIEDKIEYGFQNYKTSEPYNNLLDFLRNNISDLADSEKLNNIIEGAIQEKVEELRKDSRTIESLLPASITQSVRLYIYNNRDTLIQFIKEGLRTPSVREKLKATIASMVEENLGKLVTMFISIDTIGNKIIDSIERNIDTPENQESIIHILINGFDRIISGEVMGIAAYFTHENTEKLSREVSKLISSFMKEGKGIDKLVCLMEENLRNSEGKFKDILKDNVIGYIDDYIKGEELSMLIGEFVDKALRDLLVTQPVSELLGGFNQSTITMITKSAEDIYDELVKNRAPQIAEIIDIPRIVEDRINSFDVAMAENIILEIANKELSAITWLGALLGGIMGLLTPLLELLT